MTEYAAVIVDSRPIDSTIVKNHMKHLSDDWALHIWTAGNNYIDYPHYRHVYKSGGAMNYNYFVTSREFLRPLLKYKRVLIFQQDSMILRSGIEEFLEYDYVGAPWKATAPWARKDRAGGNGGLSVRNPAACMDLALFKPYSPAYGNEDVYYTHSLENVAPYEICKRFSVETEYQLGTFGYHAIQKHLSNGEVRAIVTQYQNIM